MKIIFSDHAKKQRIERKIPLKDVLETIKKPQNKLKSFRNRQLLQRKFGDKILEVVTSQEKDITTIVTQYYLIKEES